MSEYNCNATVAGWISLAEAEHLIRSSCLLFYGQEFVPWLDGLATGSLIT